MMVLAIERVRLQRLTGLRSFACRATPASRRRNAGVAVSLGKVIAFIDDDCEADAAWAETLASAFEDAPIDGIGGLVVPACSSRFLDRYLKTFNPLRPLTGELLASSSSGYRLRLYMYGT